VTGNLEHDAWASVPENEGHLLEDLGPFYDKAGAASVLAVTVPELEQRVAAHRVLAVETGAGQQVFPTWQFTPAGEIERGLGDVLDALLSAADPWTAVIWLTTSVDRFGDASVIDCLRSGIRIEAVKAAAVKDAASWAT